MAIPPIGGSPAEGDVIELRIPSSAAYISVARHAVESVARRLPFGQSDVEDVKLAVGEACNNAVKHSLEQDSGGPVTVRCIVSPRSLEIEVRNCHAANLPCPDVSRAPDLNKEGGLGFYLMRQLVDHVEFTWGDDFALVRLVKRIRKT